MQMQEKENTKLTAGFRTNLYLIHFGIKGQHWGVRRYQNEDGTLTNAGKKRYDVDLIYAKNRLKEANKKLKDANDKFEKETKGSSYTASKETTQELIKSTDRVKWAKKLYSEEKIKDKLNSQDKKSKRQEKLEKQYIDKGLSKQEAEIQAYKRARTEKILKATMALTVTAAVAYTAYKVHDQNIDKIIPKGTKLSRLSPTDNAGVHDAFYAATNKRDSDKYVGLFGTDPDGNYKYQKTMQVTSDIKLAGRKTAIKALDEMVKNDPDFKKDLQTQINLLRYNFNDSLNALNKRASKSLSKGKVNKDVYDALNVTLTAQTTVTNKFYDTLKSKGYDAIIDSNDKKYSGFNAKSPTIIFTGSSKVRVDNVRKLTTKEVVDKYTKENGRMYAKAYSRYIVGYGALGAAGVGFTKKVENNATNSRQNKIVNEYKKQHPNSKLSKNEILDIYYK